MLKHLKSRSRWAVRSRRYLSVATAAVVFGAALVSASEAVAVYGDGYDLADSQGAALPSGKAFWAGTCDLKSPLTDVGVAPAAPRDCIDAGTMNLNALSVLPWTVAPSWRLAAVTQAGAHPDASATFTMARTASLPPVAGGQPFPDGSTRDIVVDLPPGFVGNPEAVERCPDRLFTAWPVRCPAQSQVGLVNVRLNGGQGFVSDLVLPVYSLEPRPGRTAEFGIPHVVSTLIRIEATARTDSDFGISTAVVHVPPIAPLLQQTVTFWGTPWDSSHDAFRFGPTSFTAVNGVASIPPMGPTGLAPADRAPYDPSWGSQRHFLSNPTECTGEEPLTHLALDSWQAPGTWLDFDVAAPPVEGCEAVPFDGSLDATPDSQQAGASSGYAFDLSIPQGSDPAELATGHLKKAVVELPEGLRVNPSAADGLDGCTLAEAKLNSRQDVDCPDASKIGTLRVDTPLLPDPLEGSVYLGHPDSNKFDSLLSLILVARGPGLVVKIPGRVDSDSETGRLTAVFDENPRLPFSDLHLEFKDGPRAPLSNPPTCGSKVVSTELTSWSGKSVTDGSPIEISGCPGPRGFAPSLDAGVADAKARSSSPFAMRLQRSDLDNELRSVSTALPGGLLAKVAGVPRCSDAQASAGACPEASLIGRVEVGAGAGSDPFYVRTGKVFLTDGYKGAPFGLDITVPAVAGPFDLGLVNVRAALRVDPRTAEVTAVSDELPRILEGIPLQVRDVRVIVDRPGFVQTPSDCDAKAVGATIGSYADETVDLANRFQVGGCEGLPFKPRLGLALVGRNQVRTGTHPRVRAVVTQAVGEAGIEKAVVRLPKSLALDPDNAQALCEFEDGIKPDLENHCPKGSIVGRARAKTPLLDQDLVGDVYFVKNVRKDPKTGNLIRTLPMIVVALRGEVAINLVGESSTSKAGKLVNTFAQVPDAPISQFNLNIAGGPNGILAVTRTRKAKINLCAGRQIAEVDTDGQNGRRHDFDVRMTTPCTKAQIKKAKRAAAKAKRG